MNVAAIHREHIEAIQGLLALPQLDFATALALLNTLLATIQASTADAVQQARTAVAAAPGGDHRHEAIARYTLAWVVVALECEAGGVKQAAAHGWSMSVEDMELFMFSEGPVPVLYNINVGAKILNRTKHTRSREGQTPAC